MRVFTKDTPSEWECTRILSPFSLNFTPIHRQNGNVRGFRALLSSNCLWTPQTIGLFLISTVQRSDCLWTPHTIGMFLISTEQRSDCLWTPQTIGMFFIFNGATLGLSMDTPNNRHVPDFNGATLGLSTDSPHNQLLPDFQRSNARIASGYP